MKGNAGKINEQTQKIFLVYFFYEVDVPILLGGDKQRKRVECDELDKGLRQKGLHGHSGKILANIWGARGIDLNDGIKKWLLFP